jgi:hypothetical protein
MTTGGFGFCLYAMLEELVVGAFRVSNFKPAAFDPSLQTFSKPNWVNVNHGEPTHWRKWTDKH